MTIAQHATNILEAWRFQDRSGLGAALESASTSRIGARPSSGLESEQSEMLESIVDHLSRLSSRNELPDPSKRNGALTLLSHLSSNLRAEATGASTNQNNFQRKFYNLAAKAPK